MKKFLLATIGSATLLGVAAPALAADMPVKAAPPVVAPIYSWAGFYIGANGGWGSSHKCWDVTNFLGPIVAFREGCHDADGGTDPMPASSFRLGPTIPRSKRSACSPVRSAMPGTTCFGM